MSVPAHRLAPIIEAYLESFGKTRGRYDEGGYTALAELVTARRPEGVCTRTLERIVHGEQTSVGEPLADAIIAALGCPDLWQLPAELGGLEDVYGAPEPQLELDLWDVAA